MTSTPTTTTPTAPLAPPWSEVFTTFGVFHAITVVGCALLVLALCLLAIRNNQKNEKTVRTVWVGFILVTQVIALVWYLWPSNFRIDNSLPLHMCDLAVWVTPFALIIQSARLRALVYFWGFGLCSQAYFTPVLDEGYASPQYWFFWLGHTQIVGSGVYIVWVNRYRPTFRHFVFAVSIGFVYAIAMVGFNEIADSNYGYVGRTLPEKRTVLHALPEWPWRVVLVMLLGVFVQFVTLVPWLVLGKLGKHGKPTDPPGKTPESNTIPR